MIVDYGYSACAGRCESGWYGGVLVLEDSGDSYFQVPRDLSYSERANHGRHWTQASANSVRKITLIQSDGDQVIPREIAVAERVEGPVCPSESVDNPTLVWVERRANQWHLRLYRDGQTITVYTDTQTIRCPGVAATGRGLIFSFERDMGPMATQVSVIDETGRVIHEVTGREPCLQAVGDGFVLATEQPDADGVTLKVEYVPDCRTGTPERTVTLAEEDCLFHADLALSDDSRTLYITSEVSPCLGYSNQIGLHRTIQAWSWDLVGDPQSLGTLPVEQRAFKSIGVENIAPIRPSISVEDGEPVILYKQHRFTGFRGFGWDVFRSRLQSGSWSEPVRITQSTITSDTGYGVVKCDDTYVGFFPCIDNVGGNGSNRCENVRVEVVTFDAGCTFDRFEIPDERNAEYRIPTSYKDIAPEPPALDSPYEGRQLVWGDLHIHTVYSKCVSAVDGDPRENVRFARDVLGCRVFGVTEHTPHTTGPESTWLYDQLEASVGDDNVLLYATEPGMDAMRHTNWYCRDRDLFERLERIIIAQDKKYPETLRQVRDEFPADSVFVLRHFHGDAIPDERIPQHFDPTFEVAMEAMQGRGNAMFEANEGCGGLFPNAFLDAGCKIGLVGGTDHYREWCPNHFCLTGFWVKEVTPEGVWEAMRNRYTIAMSNARVAMKTSCNGFPMGSDVALSSDEDLTLRLQVSCGYPVRRVGLMRDGIILKWIEVGATEATIDLTDADVPPGNHWYVATAEVATGFGDDVGICHASPYFVWKEHPQKD